MDVNDIAKEGFVKGDHYDTNRPTYTADAVRLIAREITGAWSDHPVTSVKYEVLELGAGTGKFTKEILRSLPDENDTLSKLSPGRVAIDMPHLTLVQCMFARFTTVCVYPPGGTYNVGTRYLATDASKGFLLTLQSVCPGVDSRLCTADEIPLADNSVQTVLCAQCFHWFATVAALDEIHRVLVPGGKIVLVWNMRDLSVPWVKEAEAVLAQVGEAAAEILPTTFNWRRVFTGYRGFKNEIHTQLPGTVLAATVDRVMKYYSTMSMISALQGEPQQAILARIREIVEKNVTGEGNYPFNTEIYTYVSNKEDV